MENIEREIEFRAWDKTNKVMNSWISVQKNFKQYLKSTKVIMPSGSNYVYNNNGKDEYVLMQYTTCKDSKGTKIYESDILKRDKRQGEKTACFFTVIWSQNFLAWCAVLKGTEFALNNIAQDTTVVGNIYENIKRTREHSSINSSPS